MAKVSGIVYLILGLFISIASYYINYDKLFIFFYAGWVVFIYGVAKIIIGFINKDEDKQPQLNRLNQNQPSQFRQIPKQQFKRCRTCGNTAKSFDNFCSRCGASLIGRIK